MVKNTPKKRKPTKEMEYGYTYVSGGQTYTKWCRDINERNKAVRNFKENKNVSNVTPVERQINPPK